MENKKSIYETQRAIGHPNDKKKAKERLDIDLKIVYNYIKEINKK